MREYTQEDWRAFNADQRELQARVSFIFDDETYTFTQDDCLISFNVNNSLTDTLNTPFDFCCSDSCSVTLYTSYTGYFMGSYVEDFKIFDPLKNPYLALDDKFWIEMRALRSDGTWSTWVPLGIFYVSEIAVNDDRLTAVITGNDILYTVFNKQIPRQPIYKQLPFEDFITEFLNKYNLPVRFAEGFSYTLRYAYLLPTVKDTIQSLISSMACVATIHITSDLREELLIKPFKYFQVADTIDVRDYSNYTEEDHAQFITLRYNKSLLSYAGKTRIYWNRPSVSKQTTMYSYTADANSMEDFIYSKKKDWYTNGISQSALSASPMMTIEYYSVATPIKGSNNGVWHTLLTQYALTADARLTEALQANTDSPSDDDTYELVAYGRTIENAEMIEPPVTVKDASSLLDDYTVIDTIADFLTVHLPYCQSQTLASQNHLSLEAWAKCTLQTVDVQLRGNPFMELMDGLSIDAHVYDIETFAGILWSQTIRYTSGGLSVDATLVNKEAFTMGMDIYDVTAQQRNGEATVSNFYIAGKFNDYCGVWRIPEKYASHLSYYTVHYTMAAAGITDMAIAFDGVWNLSADFTHYTFITENEPWLFYCMNGILYAKHGKSSKAIKLASGGVVYCAAERGYFPRDYEDISTDQGLVVAYVTSSNKAYYRTYAYVAEDRKAWLDPEEITIPGVNVTDIQIQRLNDYRFGICLTTTTQNYWIISDRNYSQMAFKPESYIFTMPHYVRRVLFAIRTDTGPIIPQPTFTWSYNASHTELTMTSDTWLEIASDEYLMASYSTDSKDDKPINVTMPDNYHIVAIFEKPISVAMLNVTFNNEPSIDWAADVASQAEHRYGLQMIDVNVSNTYDFTTTYKVSETEYYRLSNATMRSLDVDIHPREIIKVTHEPTFVFTMPAASVTARVHPREIISVVPEETFVLIPPSLTSITVTITSSSIVPA